MTADRSELDGGDPFGKRALFSPPPQDRGRTPSPAGAVDTGVRAFYSADTRRRLGTVRVECSECMVQSRQSLIDLAARLVNFSVWIPGRRYSRWLVCPACGHRRWARVHWTG